MKEDVGVAVECTFVVGENVHEAGRRRWKMANSLCSFECEGYYADPYTRRVVAGGDGLGPFRRGQGGADGEPIVSAPYSLKRMLICLAAL